MMAQKTNTIYELCFVKTDVLYVKFLKKKINCPRKNSEMQEGLMSKGLGNCMGKSSKKNLMV